MIHLRDHMSAVYLRSRSNTFLHFNKVQNQESLNSDSIVSGPSGTDKRTTRTAVSATQITLHCFRRGIVQAQLVRLRRPDRSRRGSLLHSLRLKTLTTTTAGQRGVGNPECLHRREREIPNNRFTELLHLKI